MVDEVASFLREGNSDEVAELVGVLGNIGAPWANEILLQSDLLTHPDALVRQALAAALPMNVPLDTESPEAVEALIHLSTDDAARTRDWACFGLVLLRTEAPEALGAMAVRLTDDDVDTRAEALLALAQAGDPRAVAPLLARLALDDGEITMMDLNSAAELSDPVLLPALESLHRAWLGDEDEFQERLQFALRRCATDARARAVVAEDEVIAWEGGPGAAVISRSRSYPHTVMHVRDAVTGENLYSSALWPDEEPRSLNAPQHAENLRLTALADF